MNQAINTNAYIYLVSHVAPPYADCICTLMRNAEEPVTGMMSEASYVFMSVEVKLSACLHRPAQLELDYNS